MVVIPIAAELQMAALMAPLAVPVMAQPTAQLLLREARQKFLETPSTRLFPMAVTDQPADQWPQHFRYQGRPANYVRHGHQGIKNHNTSGYPFAHNTLKAIREIKADPSFEMYVMLGVWISCRNAWTSSLIILRKTS